MYSEDLLALVQVGQIDVNLTVKSSGTQQGLIQNIYTVGSSQYDDSTIRTESIHFCKQLVQCVFALVVTSHAGVLSTGTAHRINFIDKDDTRSLFLCLTEEVAYT